MQEKLEQRIRPSEIETLYLWPLVTGEVSCKHKIAEVLTDSMVLNKNSGSRHRNFNTELATCELDCQKCFIFPHEFSKEMFSTFSMSFKPANTKKRKNLPSPQRPCLQLP